MTDNTYRVGDQAAQGLFLRSEPVVANRTKIAVLPMGHAVTKAAQSTVTGWWNVTTTLDGVAIDGFVNSRFLVPAASFAPPPTATEVAPVHLSTARVVRRADKGGLAFPLNEAGRPLRANANGSTAAQELTSIVKWLDVERSERYAPTSQHTYCNIYAYDYCHLAGAYLPRVWWTPGALDRLRRGQPESPVYGRSVTELNANSLFAWLKQHGSSFGWARTFDVTTLQDAANSGQVAVICAENRKPNRSGHISAVVPETASNEAVRNGATVIRPLQSQAGRSNVRYMTQQWWTRDTFRDWGFWTHP
jgi:hypothetical protein